MARFLTQNGSCAKRLRPKPSTTSGSNDVGPNSGAKSCAVLNCALLNCADNCAGANRRPNAARCADAQCAGTRSVTGCVGRRDADGNVRACYATTRTHGGNHGTC